MMYYSEPNRAEPSRHLWFCVETPGVFREYKLPACEIDWTAADRRKHRELLTLAEIHNTHVSTGHYRRGSQ